MPKNKLETQAKKLSIKGNEDILTKIKKAETSSKSPVNPPSNNSITPNESAINKEMLLDSRNDAKYIETDT